MLYFSQSLNGGSANRLYGLRLERGALPPMLPGASSAAPSRQRELVNMHFAAGEDLRIDFGRRLSWDFGRQEFSMASTAALRPIPVRAAAAVEACAARCAVGAQPH